MRTGRSFWGVFLVLLGLLLLLRSTGILNINLGGIIGPLFLIGLGVMAIWGAARRSEPLSIEEVHIPLEQAEKVRLSIHHSAARLHVDGSAAAGELLSGAFAGGLKRDMRQEGDITILDLRSATEAIGFFAPWHWGERRSRDWTMRLSRDVWLALDLDVEASETRLDLTDLQVHELSMQAGASSNEITLPANARHTRVRISAGAASTKIRVPEGVAASIRVSGGIADIQVDTTRFPRTSSGYRSADYEGAENKADIDIDAGVATVRIR